MKTNAQDIQDKIFRKMNAETKIKLASSFYRFAKKVNPRYGTRKTPKKDRRYFK